LEPDRRTIVQVLDAAFALHRSLFAVVMCFLEIDSDFTEKL
jgi:hypothetical protein